jgi:hypothetical protein
MRVSRAALAIVSSLRPGCTPIRLVNVIGAADFDSRGTTFEDTVSVSRMFKSMGERWRRLSKRRGSPPSSAARSPISPCSIREEESARASPRSGIHRARRSAA